MRRALGLSAVCVALTTAPPLLAAQRNPDQTTDPLARHKLTGSGKEIVFIDATVTDYERLASALPHGMEVVLLDPSRDALDQITESLSRHPFAEAVHVISHGAPGQLMIGGRIYTAERMESARDKLSLWFNPLVTAGARKPDILIYGCNVGAGEKGRAFVNELASLTGADVEASSDLTGSPLMGGNWELEVSTGLIETQTATLSGAAGWDHTLALAPGGYYNVFYVTTTADSGAGSLRQAVLDSNYAGNIYYAPNVIVMGPDTANHGFPSAPAFPTGYQTITLTSEIPVTRSVTIFGATTPTNTKLVTVDGGGTNRIFNIDDSDATLYESVTLDRLVLSNGYSSANGGAIRTTESLTLNRTNVTYSSAGNGGAIAFYDTTPGQALTISRSTLSYNSANNDNGGAVWTNDLYYNAITIARSKLLYNTANYYGGALFVENAQYSSIAITGTNYPAPSHATFAHNSAGQKGGGAYIGDLYGSVLAVTVADFNRNSAGSDGGGMAINNVWGYSTATITGGFYYNDSSGRGGAFFSNGTHDAAALRVAGFNDSSVSYGIKGNTASGNGGGVYIGTAQGYSLLSVGGDVGNNYSSNNGGGVFLHRARGYASANIAGANFHGNTAYYYGGGAAVRYIGESATMTVASTFDSNTASNGAGGAVDFGQGYNYGALYGNAIVTVGGKFINNSASGSGGGIHINNEYGSAAMNVGGSTFTGNTAGSGGGALYLGVAGGNSSLTINTTTMDGANASAGRGGAIGAFYLYGSHKFSVNDSTISGNSAGGNGGAVAAKYVMGSAVLGINSSTISGNSAANGGGLFVGLDSGGSNLSVSHATVALNTATGAGGGIDASVASANLDHALVAGNIAGVNTQGNDLYTGGTFYAQWSLISDIYNAPNIYTVYGTTNVMDPYATIPVASIIDTTLADNGSLTGTKTHMLVAGGPAVDAGNPNFAPPPATDQRGFKRVAGAAIDIGSVESGSTTSFPVVTPNNHLGLANGGAGSLPLMGSLMLGLAGLWRRVRRRVYGD